MAGWSANPIFEGARCRWCGACPSAASTTNGAESSRSINLGRLDDVFADGETVTPETLKAKGVLKGRYELLKVLGDGQLTKRLKISAHRFSETALAKIQQAGGEAIVLPEPAPVVEEQDGQGRRRKAVGRTE